MLFLHMFFYSLISLLSSGISIITYVGVINNNPDFSESLHFPFFSFFFLFSVLSDMGEDRENTVT